MLPASAFLTTSLQNHPHGQSITRILAAAIAAVEPGQAVNRFFQRNGNTLTIQDRDYDLGETRRIYTLAVGKAALGMLLPVTLSLSDHAPRGLLIPKQPVASPPAGFEVIQSGHPVPDTGSFQAGQAALELASGLREDDLLICLISGGGSALMTAPYPGLELEDVQALTRALLACGARVDEINTLRRHLDRVKGGGLARAAAPAKVISLILSDVVGNPFEAIASGPTAPDPSTKADALEIMDRYDLRQAKILRVLEDAPETPKHADELFGRVQNVIVGSNFLAAQSALKQAQVEGLNPIYLGDAWQGEARAVAVSLCAELKLQLNKAPICMVAGGETTVTLRGNGRGGRNQELALAAVRELDGLNNVMLVTLATDGEDGPTDAAGAVVMGKTCRQGLELGLLPEIFLENNDAYTYFETLGDLLKTGPTGTNVNDLTFLFAF